MGQIFYSSKHFDTEFLFDFLVAARTFCIKHFVFHYEIKEIKDCLCILNVNLFNDKTFSIDSYLC